MSLFRVHWRGGKMIRLQTVVATQMKKPTSRVRVPPVRVWVFFSCLRAACWMSRSRREEFQLLFQRQSTEHLALAADQIRFQDWSVTWLQ